MVRSVSRRLGLLGALLALVSLLAVGAVVGPVQARQSDVAAVDAASILCFPGGGKGDRPAVPHHAMQAALCPAGASHALQAIVPVSPAVPSFTEMRVSHPAIPPQARAPPASDYPAASPRGPPRLA